MANHQCAWKLIYTKTLKKILHTCSVIDHMLCQNMVRTKKWHMGCSLACSRHSVKKMDGAN